jgi:hypothetical protein
MPLSIPFEPFEPPESEPGNDSHQDYKINNDITNPLYLCPSITNPLETLTLTNNSHVEVDDPCPLSNATDHELELIFMLPSHLLDDNLEVDDEETDIQNMYSFTDEDIPSRDISEYSYNALMMVSKLVVSYQAIQDDTINVIRPEPTVVTVPPNSVLQLDGMISINVPPLDANIVNPLINDCSDGIIVVAGVYEPAPLRAACDDYCIEDMERNAESLADSMITAVVDSLICEPNKNWRGFELMKWIELDSFSVCVLFRCMHRMYFPTMYFGHEGFELYLVLDKNSIKNKWTPIGTSHYVPSVGNQMYEALLRLYIREHALDLLNITPVANWQRYTKDHSFSCHLGTRESLHHQSCLLLDPENTLTHCKPTNSLIIPTPTDVTSIAKNVTANKLRNVTIIEKNAPINKPRVAIIKRGDKEPCQPVVGAQLLTIVKRGAPVQSDNLIDVTEPMTRNQVRMHEYNNAKRLKLATEKTPIIRQLIAISDTEILMKRTVALGTLFKDTDVRFIIDSGASAHSGSMPELFVTMDRLPFDVKIVGISDTNLICTHGGVMSWNGIGEDFPSLGPGIYMPNSNFNLISYGTLMLHGVHIVGNPKDLTMTLTKFYKGKKFVCVCPMTHILNIFEVRLINGKMFIEQNEKRSLVSSIKNSSVPTRNAPQNFSKNQTIRASIVKEYHEDTMHPGTTTMINASKLKVAGGITPVDIKLWQSFYDRCSECDLAKMKQETRLQINSKKPNRIGESLAFDIRESGNGNGEEIIIVCTYSGNISIAHCSGKLPNTLFDAIVLHLNEMYVAYGHKTVRLHSDPENTLISMKPAFARMGIELTSAGPGDHCKMAERYIQTLDRRSLAVVLGLIIKWKKKLNYHLHRSVAHYMNMTPNSHTAQMIHSTTPFNLRTNDIYSHIEFNRAKFGHIYAILDGDAKRSREAAVQNQSKQLIPHSSMSLCLGPSHPFNTTTDSFLQFPNERIVHRNTFLRMDNVCPVGYELNPYKTIYTNLVPNSLDDGLNELDTEVKPNNNNNKVNSAWVTEQAPIKPISVLGPEFQIDKIDDGARRYSDPSDLIDEAPVPTGPSLTGELLKLPPVPVPTAQDLWGDFMKSQPNYTDHLVVKPPTVVTPLEEIIEIPVEPTEPQPRRYPTRSRLSRALITFIHGFGLLALWAAFVLLHPTNYIGAATIISKPQMLIPKKKNRLTFSFNKAMLLDPEKAIRARDKELAKFDFHECFKEAMIPYDPNSTDELMYPLFPFRYKIDSVTGEKLEMSARLAIDGSNEEDVPENEKSTHTANQQNVNTVKASYMAYLIKEGLLGNFFCNSFDVIGAFLHVPYESTSRVFVRFPKDFPGPQAGKTLLMVKAVYGVKRSNFLFSKELHNCFIDAGFFPLPSDRSIYVKYGENGKPRSICFTHVDDGQFLSTFKSDWTDLVSKLEARFGVLTKNLPSTGHVGINTEFFPDGSFSTHQSGYILKSLKLVDPDNVLTPQPTPSLKDLFVNDPNSPSVDITFYQTLIGILIYALHTRYDIIKEVLWLAKQTSNPTEHDLIKVTRVFAYLKSSPNYGPTFFTTEGPILYCFVDASFNIHWNTGRSHDGHFTCIGMNSGPCMAKSKQQLECISLSATEAEYVALSSASKTVLRLRQVLLELGYEQMHPTRIYEDCKSAVAMVHSMEVNKKSAHINVRMNHVKDLQAQMIIDVQHITREFQRADFLGGREMTESQFKQQRLQFMTGVDIA